ncbi:hypothetical protein Tco_0099031 [Tanacetum coccineum]
MASSITRFDIKKFDGKNDFGLWQIKTCALMVQQGCDAALETLPADMKAGEKTALMKKAYSTLILCLGDRVLREVTKETTAAGIRTKLTSLYMTKSLANRLYLKKKLYTDVLATSDFKELKKRTEAQRNHSDGQKKRDCQIKKSSGFVKKGKRDQDSDSSDDEGNAYFGKAPVVVRNDEMAELLGDNRTCTIKGRGKVKIQLHDGSSFILEDVRLSNEMLQFAQKDSWRTSTLEEKTNNRLRWKLKGNVSGKKKVKESVKESSVQNHGGSKQVILKQLSYKQVGFKQLGHKQVGLKQLGLGVKTGVYGVQDVKRVWFEVELQGAQGDREAEVWANITVTGVLGQEGAEGNVARKKKVKEYKKANLWKLLKYNAWSIRWSPIRGSGMRKRCITLSK